MTKNNRYAFQQSEGTSLWRTLRELATNSAHYPFLLILLEINHIGIIPYFKNLSHWALLISPFVQAIYLSGTHTKAWQIFLGNLIGVALYTAVDLGGEGLEFFEKPEHIAYWAFAISIALAQFGRIAMEKKSQRGQDFFRTAENTIRTMIIPAVYFISLIKISKSDFPTALVSFFNESSHHFLVQAIFIIGIFYGVNEVLLARNRSFLLVLIERLRHYSSWFIDSSLMENLVETGGEAATKRAERTVLFMDIRGFTNWSSIHMGTEVGDLLNGYYEIAGPIIAEYGGLMNNLTGDEVMAIFHDPRKAVQCTRALQAKITPYLGQFDLGAGVGLHCGEVVEGLFGTSNKKVFSVMGMPVNIAKRLEGCADSGSIVFSESILKHLGDSYEVPVESLPPVSLKGVPEPVPIYKIKYSENGDLSK
ncbi:MAG: adenylate/guanylate cyclase domain-containing protein [Nitrospinaceae bacterium]|jgi:adenylate cyclase|nr:adenylate/guanylate cyclase domain-containing protein [Nitrospinaceae bacterium]MBT3435720.1 adenylate/guanylate cyclase domain-containing protein [Nitrospinaceae bacterium]MBT3820562.1 adenylate/guanylate cyclase domain-containing protein [Nitrospinaceae bacterium]MBT4095273.1 adenylate/guanylate cyclase domain-containing protein [Nitrospinaceae bacterium]MBT4429102.1 adenylate/guanylate cyclase domain-containing protein [Nitrospinaceae bacterium]